MTQKEAVIKALEKLKGVGELKDIIALALIIDKKIWENTKTPEASIRRIVRTNPKEIVPLDNSRYELVSHIEEVHRQNEELERLRTTPTKQAFVSKMLDKIVNTYKYDEKALDYFYKLFTDLSEDDAAEIVAKLLEKKNDEAKDLLKAFNKLVEEIAKVANKKTIGTLVMEQNNHGVNSELSNGKNDQQLLANG